VVGGGRGNVRFTNGALKAIYESSQGNPRRINAICDRALLAAYARDEFTISKGTVRKATEDIMGDVAPKTRVRDWPQKRVTLLAVLLFLLVFLAGLAGWTYRAHILGIFSPKEEVAVPIPKSGQKVSIPIPKREVASLFLAEEASLAVLFRLFKEKAEKNSYAGSTVHMGLFSFNTKIENCIMFKRPFRVILPTSGAPQSPSPSQAGIVSSMDPSSRYLLVHKVTADGATVIDAEGKDRLVTTDFLRTHWGQGVSWVYPYKNKDVSLVKGMTGAGVLKVQETLKKIGYPLEITGTYDDSTFRHIKKFQSGYGLIPDGIAGTRTKALLYQMSE